MKKLIYLGLLISGILMLQSCKNEQDDIFDSSAAQRVAQAMKESDQILKNAPNGWIMNYYAGGEAEKMGGYSLWCSFEEDRATFASELTLGKEETSLYRFIGDQGPVLTFDTYNPFLHIFSEPQNGPTTFKGDYEFIVVSASAEKMVLRGKKFGNIIVMTPLPVGEDKDAYLIKVSNLAKEASEIPKYDVLVNGAAVGTSDFTFEREYTFTIGTDILAENAIYTPTGILFYAPITIAGVTVQHFNWNSSDKTYTSTDEGTNVVLKEAAKSFDYMSYKGFAGSYQMSYINQSNIRRTKTVTLSVTESPLSQSYILSGASPFDFRMRYNMKKGCLELYTQVVGTVMDKGVEYPLWLQLLDITYDWADQGLQGVWNGSLTSNKVKFQTAPEQAIPIDVFLLLAFTKDGLALYNADTWYEQTSMTKQ